jgi:hydrogenase maturation protease
MKRPLIIGFGNPLRGDDGIGWRAAELLEAELGAAAEIVACHQLTPELAPSLGGASVVIFLDASVAQAPGQVSESVVTPADPATFTHHLTPAQLLGMARHFGPVTCSAVLIACGVLNTNAGEELSDPAQTGVRKMVSRARAHLPL